MAGNYPNIPGRRFPLTQDGSTLWNLPQGLASSTAANDQLPIIDDTDDDSWYIYGRDQWGGTLGNFGAIAVVFPEKRDITGYWACLAGGASIPQGAEYSTDTTNGQDGTWTVGAPTFTRSTVSQPYNRTLIQTVNWPGVKGVRFKHGLDDSVFAKRIYWVALHLFGNITAGQNPDRLHFWEPVNDIAAGPAYFDMAEVYQGQTKTRTFRVKNLSSTLTATGVVLAASSQSFPELATGLQFSSDGTTFSSSLNIGTLAPGALSGVITLRRVAGASEAAGFPKNGYLTATATTWV